MTFKPRRKWDWTGMLVRSRTELRTMRVILPAGTEGIVTYAYGGLTIWWRPCRCCGVSLCMTKVLPREVEAVRRFQPPPPYLEPIRIGRDEIADLPWTERS